MPVSLEAPTVVAFNRTRPGRGERGQVMVLAALGALLVAIMMLLTLNLGQSIFEKIRIQQLADSVAFSTATQEARAFNFFAYTNRANIASLVAAASVHGYMSMASHVPVLFDAAATNFDLLAVEELIICLMCCEPPYCTANCEHCGHAANDLNAAQEYRDQRDDLRDEVEELDDKFIEVIEAIDTHMYFIAASQLQMKLGVFGQIQSDTLAKELADNYAPQAEGNLGGVAALNAGLPPQMSEARGFWGVFEDDQEIIQWLATEIANGTRFDEFVYKRDLTTLVTFINTDILMDLMYDIPMDNTDGGYTIVYAHDGQSRIIKDPDSPRSRIVGDEHGPVGDSVAALDELATGEMISTLANNCYPTIVNLSSYQAWVASGGDGGDHEDQQGCSGEDEHELRCLSSDSPSCFTVFKPEPAADKNFGQPVVYSVFSQDLSLMERGGRGPWEVTDSGTIKVNLSGEGGTVGEREVHISNRSSQGVAMSKALVYYHFPNDKYGEGWKEHPNFFNPYWKAKLQPYRNAREARNVLSRAGIDEYHDALVTATPPPLP